jgi:hypothetical protein
MKKMSENLSIFFLILLFKFISSLMVLYCFQALGLLLVGREGGSQKTRNRRFRSFFGTSGLVCHKAWELLQASGSLDEYPGLTWDHFLWSLSFLKCYSTEAQLSALYGIDEKTYRKWVWLCVELISLLDVVSSNSSSKKVDFFLFFFIFFSSVELTTFSLFASSSLADYFVY